ncbi:DUF5597 domain-containing protein [Edaphobacter modestus]|uniref:DUF5597 domain-containing protein n=1 Tax=Edaphobacter modestus TaxID=388466 RepID=UPI003BF8D1DB
MYCYWQRDAHITFSTNLGRPSLALRVLIEESFENGAWVPRRRLNGDENSQGQALRLYDTDFWPKVGL